MIASQGGTMKHLEFIGLVIVTLPSSMSSISVESRKSSLPPPVIMVLLVFGMKAHLCPPLSKFNWNGITWKVWLSTSKLRILFLVPAPPINQISSLIQQSCGECSQKRKRKWLDYHDVNIIVSKVLMHFRFEVLIKSQLHCHQTQLQKSKIHFLMKYKK